MSAIASDDEQWYFVPPHVCFSEYSLHSGLKKMQQKVLARSTQRFETASVELTSFHLDCFGITGTSVLENAGPDATFVFSVSFDIPPPEGLLLQGEFHSNFQDQVHLRHSASGAIMATLTVKAIWDLTPDHAATFYPTMLSSLVASSCQPRPVILAERQVPSIAPASTSKQQYANQECATTEHAFGLRRPKYDKDEDLFYRSLLSDLSAECPRDSSSSLSFSAPKDSRIKLTADDAAFYSTVITGAKFGSSAEEIKKPKATKPTVNFEGDDIIIIDGIRYDTWGNVIADKSDTTKPQVIQDKDEAVPAYVESVAKKKLPQLGPTMIAGSNVPAMLAPVAAIGNDHDECRYLEILNGNLIPETQDSRQVQDFTNMCPAKNIGVTGSHGSSKSIHGAISGLKSSVSSSVSSRHQKLQDPARNIQSKKSSPKCAAFLPLKSEDDFNDAWDAL